MEATQPQRRQQTSLSFTVSDFTRRIIGGQFGERSAETRNLASGGPNVCAPVCVSLLVRVSALMICVRAHKGEVRRRTASERVSANTELARR